MGKVNPSVYEKCSFPMNFYKHKTNASRTPQVVSLLQGVHLQQIRRHRPRLNFSSSYRTQERLPSASVCALYLLWSTREISTNRVLPARTSRPCKSMQAWVTTYSVDTSLNEACTTRDTCPANVHVLEA